jgi:adenosylcobinamide kinase/adenosylcobinamide-phosphate guanylyltransferase
MSAWRELLGHEDAPGLTLVLGGARSGKSRLAERLVAGAGPGATPTYIATAQAFDDEMTARIARHREERGDRWITIEAPHDLPQAVAAAPPAPLLVDCLTLWLSNRMLAGADVETDREDLLQALGDRGGATVVVSNETGLGIVPDTPLGRRFRDAQGTLNQRVAAAADCVAFVAAGLPMLLKRP